MKQIFWLWQRSGWPELRYDTAAVLPAVLAANAVRYRLLGLAEAFDRASALRFASEIMVDEGVTTAAIEGEIFQRDSVRSSVARQLKLSTAGLPEPEKRADGVVAMLHDAAQNHAKPLTAPRLFRWHRGLFPNDTGITRGAWRNKGAMRVVSLKGDREIVHFDAPPDAQVPPAMQDFFAWVETPSEPGTALMKTALAHVRFLTIHPFEDGNGRTARALTDLLLAREDGHKLRFFSVAARLLKQHAQYYAILESTQRGDIDVTPWVLWFVGEIQAACQDSLNKIKAVFARDAFWIHHRATNLSPNQRKVLNRMLDAGPEGFVGGINAAKYVSLTGVSRITASRDLADLVAKRCLRPLAKAGRNAAYMLVLEGT